MPIAAPVSRAVLHVDSRLARLVVETRVGGNRSTVDGGFAEALARALEPVYRKNTGAGDRAEGFDAVYRRFFAEWGYEGLIEEVVDEHPLAARAVDAIWLGCAEREGSAGADLGGPALRQLGISLPFALFSEPEALRLFLRRELLHVEDTLDPEFGYRPGPLLAGRPGAMENLARDRLRLLWGLSVDGRLARRFPEYERLRADGLEQARELYRSLPQPLPERLVVALWSGPRPRFEELRLQACDNERLFEAYLPEARPEIGQFLAGSPCPLCGFPVARIVVKWEGAEQRRLTPRIREDFPEWRQELGACERCLEGYAVREGTWL
jgi:hypothetical protein